MCILVVHDSRETSTRSEAEILGNPQIPETSTRSEAKILGNPQIPETGTRSEAKIQGNPQISETSTRSEEGILAGSALEARGSLFHFAARPLTYCGWVPPLPSVINIYERLCLGRHLLWDPWQIQINLRRAERAEKSQVHFYKNT